MEPALNVNFAGRRRTEQRATCSSDRCAWRPGLRAWSAGPGAATGTGAIFRSAPLGRTNMTDVRRKVVAGPSANTCRLRQSRALISYFSRRAPLSPPPPPPPPPPGELWSAGRKRPLDPCPKVAAQAAFKSADVGPSSGSSFARRIRLSSFSSSTAIESASQPARLASQALESEPISR